jgi:hypothetical protein
LNLAFELENETIKTDRMGRLSKQCKPIMATKARKTTTKDKARFEKNEDFLPNLSPIRILKQDDEEDVEERHEEAAGDNMYLSCKNIDDDETDEERSVYNFLAKKC